MSVLFGEITNSLDIFVRYHMDLSIFHYERSRKDIRHFYEWLGYSWGDHIEEWVKIYQNRGESEVHRTCIVAPRDHSKSTTLRVVLAHNCLFRKWRDKPYTVWLFSASKDTARNRLAEIREDLTRHPDLRRMIDERRGGKHELRFNNGAWIKATSVGSAIRGEHPACVAFDDVLVDLGDLSMDSVRDWMRKVITPMLSPGTDFYVVGTPMSKTDIYHTEMLHNETWVTGVWSAFLNWDEWKSEPGTDLKALWPEHRSVKFILEQRQAMGDLAFIQEYLCRVVDDDAQVYPRTLIRKHLNMEATLEAEKHHADKYAIGFDPSHGLKQDYSVMMVVRQDPKGNIHIVNMWRRNDFPPAKQVEEIIRWCQSYKMPMFASEDVGFQRLYASLINQQGVTVDFRPSKVSNKGLKQALLNRLRVWFEQEKIQIPYGDDKTRRTMEIMLDELENHVWKAGDITDIGRHNDTVMALAHAIDQFSFKDLSAPMVTGTTTMSKWKGEKSGKGGLPGGRFVYFRG